MNTKGNLSVLGIAIGLSLIVAAFIVANTFVRVKAMDNVLSVSGSATKDVTADNARWTGSFSRIVSVDQLKNGYAQMKVDEAAVRNFFNSQGFTDVEISPVFMNEIYNYKSEQGVGPKQYNLVQNVKVRSTDVNKMQDVAKSSDKLISAGVLFSAGPVEYFYSKLPELRVSLLPEALKDAKARAEAIASSSGKKVDAIKSAAMGVVQVMSQGTVDISDYGSYDTSAVQKTVMITVRASFTLK